MFNGLRFFASFQLFMPFELLRFDPQTYEPVRTAAGRCLRAQRGKPIPPTAPHRQQISGRDQNLRESLAAP